MKSLHDIKVFLETAKLGSLSAAARSLDQTPAAISRTIQRLEAELDAPLFIRSTRKLRLSPQGEKFLPRCQQAMGIFEQGVSELKEDEQTLSGTISLSMPSDTGRGVLAPIIDRFLQLHPKVSLHLHLSDGYADLYKQNVDVAIRIGEPEDSSMVALPLLKNNFRALVASPGYLKNHPSIQHPKQLSNCNCLCFTLHDRWHNRWQFTHVDANQQVLIEVKGNRKSSDGALVHQWAVEGHGIAYKSLLDVYQDLHNGSLVRVCEEWQGEHAPLYMVFTDRIQYNAVFKELRAFLEKELHAYFPT